jgi:hypothetical protein
MEQLLHFIKGFGSVLTLMPPPAPKPVKRRFPTASEALASDWNRVGNALRGAMNKSDSLLDQPIEDIHGPRE